MQTISIRHIAAAVIALAAMNSLTACSPNISNASARPASDITVADAFEASTTMHFKPYTRSIFSTTDF